MRKLSYLLLLLFFLPALSYAQKGSVKGNIKDTAERKQPENAVVALLRKSDSILTHYTRTGKDGSFQINNVDTGKYILLVTHPTFADYIDEVTVTSATADIGMVMLTQRSKLLDEVVVRQQIAAIRMKGDTLEFKADSFKVRANASAEELLKKLPGIQVTKNGEIRAQGEKVTKVLVDGDEFFGDDPGIATKNIRADAVDKVQVFDKKSDQATFSGIDDGEKTKTINLSLKQDKKNGYFGRVSLGSNGSNFFNNEAMGNLFKGKKKVAAFATMSNTGRTGLGFEDSRNYGGGSDGMVTEISDDGGVMVSMFGGSDEFGEGFDGSFAGQGLPKSWTAGGHFSNKWNTDKHNVNGSYRFSKLNTIGNNASQSQTILPDTLFFNNSNGSSFSQSIRNKANATYDIKIDSFNSVKISANGALTTSKRNNRFFSEALNEENSPVNRSNRLVTSEGDARKFQSSVLWRRRFRKAGRTFSLNINQSAGSSKSDGFLNAINDFYQAGGVLLKKDTTDQEKISSNANISFNTKISFTEALSKKLSVEWSYALNSSNSENKRNSFDKVNGKYESLNPLFSNEYAFRVRTHNGGMSLRVKTKKYNFSVGGNVARTNFRQTDLLKDSAIDYSFVNFFPRSAFRYSFSQFRSFNINYDGASKQPSIEQLQPVRENTDPLNISVGNPDLKQEFRHNFNMGYNDYKVLSNRSIYFNSSFSLVQNAITNSDRVDSLGRKVFQAINTNGNFNLGVYGGYYKKIKSLDLDANLSLNLSINRNISEINGLRNVNNNKSYGVNMYLSKSKEKQYDIGLQSGIYFTNTRSSIRPDVVTRFWTQEHNLDVDIDLPWKLLLNTECNFSLRQKTDVFDRNNNVIKWNAGLSRKLLKDDQAAVEFTLYDILNQNVGVQRSAESNFINQSTFDVIRRYFLLKFTWNFSKNGKPSSGFF
jgi:Outer membrane protein beta-barrel family/Carboxypeptidase regulatory-like domain